MHRIWRQCYTCHTASPKRMTVLNLFATLTTQVLFFDEFTPLLVIMPSIISDSMKFKTVLEHVEKIHTTKNLDELGDVWIA